MLYVVKWKFVCLATSLLLLLNACNKGVDCSLNNKTVNAKVLTLSASDTVARGTKVPINVVLQNQNSGCVRESMAALAALNNDTFLVTAQLVLTPTNQNCKCLTEDTLNTTVFFEPKVPGRFTFVTEEKSNANIGAGGNSIIIIVK